MTELLLAIGRYAVVIALAVSAYAAHETYTDGDIQKAIFWILASNLWCTLALRIFR